MRKGVVFCAGLLVGLALMFVSQHLTSDQPGATVENFSQFLERVETDKLKEVTYTGGDEIAYVTTDGKSFVTTAPPPTYAYVGLTNRLVQRGVVVKAKDPR